MAPRSRALRGDARARGAPGDQVCERARELALHLIITDHHDLEHTLPNALAVINPKRPDCGYEFKQLAGVGVAFRLAQALLASSELAAEMPDFAAQDLLDLVAIGTIADVMPLVGENRSLVQAGLRAINTHPRLGVAALTKAARLRNGHISAGQIGFQLAPRLNAAGRLDNLTFRNHSLDETLNEPAAYQALTAKQVQETVSVAENVLRRLLANVLIRLQP